MALLLALLAAEVSRVSADVTTLDCGELTLGFDSSTGQWVELAGPGGGNLLGPPPAPDVVVHAIDRPWPETAQWSATPPELARDADGATVTIERRGGDWSISSAYRVTAGHALARQVTLAWHGTGKAKIRAVDLRVPGVTLGGAADGLWCIPGNYPVEAHPFAATDGPAVRERGWTGSDSGVAYAASESAGLSVIAAYALTVDHASVSVEPVPGGCSIVHRFEVVADLNPGDEITVGVEHIRVALGGRDALRAAAAELAERANPGPPADRPEWLDGSVIAEVHPWGRLEIWGQGDKGRRLPDLEACLLSLRDLGVDATWLLPVSNKPPWVYSLPEFRRIDPGVGTAEELRSYVAAGHEVGIRTLMDLVTYGVSPDSPDVAALPETVWCLGEDGQRVRVWGGSVLAADCSDPDWRAHTVDLTSYWVREFGVDGFRLDCGGLGQTLNWKPRTGLRASAPIWPGGIEQNRLIRDAIRRINSDAILLPEQGATAILNSADLMFDYPFYMVCREITREPDTARWVRQAREWLAAQQLTMSPRQQRSILRFLENHDTVAAQDYFGTGPSQALTALCVFLPGSFLLHQEEQFGFAPELRRWLKLRRESRELSIGDADFEAVASSDPRVLAFLRTEGKRASLVAVSFAPEEVRTTFTVAERYKQPGARWVDAFSGDTFEPGDPVSIRPYAPRILARSRLAAPSDRPAAPGAPGASGSLVLGTDRAPGAEGTTIERIRLAPLAEWLVASCEGTMTGWFSERTHQVPKGPADLDLTPTLERCWRPLEHGLWDGPGPTAIGGWGDDGRGVLVRFADPASLRSARLDDPSGKGEAAVIEIVYSADRDPGVTVEESADGAALLARACDATFRSQVAGADVDPLWVRLRVGARTVALARRHGGAIASMRREGAGPESDLLREPAMLYTDWGLFEKGSLVSTDGETNPRLVIGEENGAPVVTFRGRLRGPSWNGVQTAPAAGPDVAYRLTYRVAPPNILRVTVAVTSSTDRADASAFLAYRMPFGGVARWRATGGKDAEGSSGAAPGQRVYQGSGAPESIGTLGFRLEGEGGGVTLRGFGGTPARPQNPFLVDDGAGGMQLFFAMLDGAAVSLKAGEERVAEFEIVLE